MASNALDWIVRSFADDNGRAPLARAKTAPRELEDIGDCVTIFQGVASAPVGSTSRA